MELNASTIEAIVKKIVSEMDTPAAAADDQERLISALVKELQRQIQAICQDA